MVNKYKECLTFDAKNRSESTMTSKSIVLAIGTESKDEIKDIPTIRHDRKASFQSDFEEHMQKILLNGGKPLESFPNDKVIQRFAANGLKKNEYHYYEFARGINRGCWIIDGPTFEPKGILRRVKERISKDHWITDNVAKFKKDSRDFVQKTVSNALHEEQVDIFQYLCYLNENCNKK
ncbi:uncharacterized protein LOC108112957 [Drosophila eugracilis]|uniref:uncharacterized protein LOC108112957 n=1 Tax=Drosophila eugracilis TaxID=29029 RepID=UPI0007E6276D|nr:uncharacterized protein LOC108112957 [Drosophila eugracilis]